MSTPRIHIAVAVSALVTLPIAASAQEAQDGEFSVQRFEPVAGPKNYLGVAGARMDGELSWSAGLMFDYQRDPFVLKSCVSETDCAAPGAEDAQDVAVVQDLLTWNLLGSLTPIPWIQIGLRVPILYASGQGINLESGGANNNGLSGAGLGDLNLEGKFRLFGEPADLIVLAAAADLSAPLGHATGEGNFIGNETPLTGAIRGIVDFKIEDFSAALNLRGVFKKNATLGDTTLGPEFQYSVAAAYQVHELFRPLLEARGSTVFSSANGTNTLELDGGLQLTPLDGRLVITVAGGTGLLKGIGMPIGRGIVGVAFNYDSAADQDGDGIADDDDQCVSDAEDKDGVDDSDGCPDDDIDHDNIPDEVDGCPDKPETDNNYKDDDGCPDNPSDRDKDGVWDDEDKCPDALGTMRRPEYLGCPDSDEDGVADQVDACKGEKEDTDGFKDLDGCADPDNDGDGVPDLADECGEAPETMNGVDDGDGCPDFGPDKDADGLSDDVDKCQDEAERYNGNQDDDGCADVGGDLVKVNPKEIGLLVKPIVIADDGVKDERTQKMLDALANALKAWKAITKIELTVTDPDAAVAQKRADAVVAFLVAKGIDKSRLVAKGVAGTPTADRPLSVKVLEAPAWTPPD